MDISDVFIRPIGEYSFSNKVHASNVVLHPITIVKIGFDTITLIQLSTLSSTLVYHSKFGLAEPSSSLARGIAKVPFTYDRYLCAPSMPPNDSSKINKALPCHIGLVQRAFKVIDICGTIANEPSGADH